MNPDLQAALHLLETKNYADFIPRLDALAAKYKDRATHVFILRLREKFFIGLNSLFDEFDEHTGEREFGPLVPPRAEHFDVHAEVVGFGYAKTYHDDAMRYLNIHRNLSRLSPSSRVLDIGCGTGNFAYALSTLPLSEGSFYGIDVSDANIRSCTRRYAQCPNFKFNLIDVALDNYHLLLEKKAASNKPLVDQVKLPIPKEFFTLQVSHSVFTHMYTEQVRNYLKQIHECLVPGGIATNTMHVMDSHAKAEVKAHRATHDFRFEKDGFYWNWEYDPLMANAFDYDLLISLYREAGLKIIEPIHYGGWANRDGPYYQDIIVAEKPR